MEKVLLGNDINFTWSINNTNFTGLSPKVYVVTSIGKTKVDVVGGATNITFKLAAELQVLGAIRLECVWEAANVNKRMVANNVIEFVDNANNVTNQSTIVSSCSIVTTGFKSTITCS